MQNLEERIRDLETENDHLLKKLKAYLAIGPLEKIVNIDDIKPAIKKAVDKNFKDLQNNYREHIQEYIIMTAMNKQLQGKVKAAILSKDYMQNGQQKYQFIVEFENGRRGRFVTLADKDNPKFKFKEGAEINYIHPKEDDDYAQIVYPKFNQVSNTNSGSNNNYEEKEIEMAKSDTETNSKGPGVITLTDQPMNQTEGMTRLNCNNAVVALVTSEAYQKLDTDGRNAMLDDIMEKSMILYVNTIQKPKLQ